MITKRSFLIGGAGAVLGSVIAPSLVEAKVKDDLPSYIVPYSADAWKQHINSVIAFDHGIGRVFENEKDFNIRLNLRIGEMSAEHGYLKYFTSSVTPSVRTRAYATQLNMHLERDLKMIQGLDPDEWFLENLAKILERELRDYETKPLGEGIWTPYLPALTVRAVDPTTFAPVMGFKTRYGYFKKG